MTDEFALQPLGIHIGTGPDGTVVALHGEVDIASAGDLDTVLSAVIARSPGTVVVDLSGVTFLDAQGLRVLIGARNGLGADDRFTVAYPSATVRRIFQVTGLDRVFRIYDGPGRPDVGDPPVAALELLRAAARSRDLINCARGVIMARECVDADGAHQALRALAMTEMITLADAAFRVVDSTRPGGGRRH